MRTRDLALRVALTIVVVVLLAWLVSQAKGFWRWQNVWRSANTSLILSGLLYTLILSLGAMVVGTLLGVAAGAGRMSRRLVPNHLSTLYVEFVRGTPLLVQIMLVFYCVDLVVGIENRVVLGILTLGVFAGAYVAEIFRAGVESVPRGQMEAARALGMTHRQAMLHVVGPQALKNALPPLAGQFISLVKDSSLLMIVGVGELAKRADQIAAAERGANFEVYLPLAGLYLLLTLPLSRFTQWLETRMGGGRRERRL